MKKLKLLTIIVITIILTIVASPVYASSPLKIIVNNKDITDDLGKPIMINGSIYLPVYPLAEALGASIQWDEMKRTLILTVTQQPMQLSNGKLLKASMELYKAVKPYTTQDFVSICNHIYYTYKNEDLYIKYFLETETEAQPADAFMRLRGGRWENLFLGTGYGPEEQYLLDIEKEMTPVILPSTLVLNFKDNLPLDQVVYFNPTGKVKSYGDKLFSQ